VTHPSAAFMTLPEIRKTVMRPTFRAPVSRPGADTRRECWQAVTTDGVWVMDRIEDDHYCKWAQAVLAGVVPVAPEAEVALVSRSDLEALRGAVAQARGAMP